MPSHPETLLSKMTLVEKIGQLRSCGYARLEPAKDGSPDPGRLKAALGDEGIGTVQKGSATFFPAENVHFVNELQRYAVEETRLGIPLLIHEEGVHGQIAYGATVFPAALALGSTWDIELQGRLFRAIAAETRARGGNQLLAPVLDLVHDPRWGRCEETYGEDPYHAARFGVAAVCALQGDDLAASDRLSAAPKHFAGYGAGQGGRNFAPARLTERDFFEGDLAPFDAVVREAGVSGLMPAHGELDGVPLHAHRHLLQTVVRERWGFEGIYVSDYGDVGRLHQLHRIAADVEEAAFLGLLAGIDLDLPSGESYAHLESVLERHPEAAEALDAAVLRVLRIKERLGLFAKPYVEKERAMRLTHCQAHRDLALEAAEKSAILLENRKDLLPLDPSALPRIAVIGPNAHPGQVGTYSPGKSETVSIRDGLRTAWGEDRIVYAQGCRITGNDEDDFDLELDSLPVQQPQLISDDDNEALIAEAESVAREADCVVLCLGGNTVVTREAFYGRGHLGDRDSITLPGSQMNLFRRLKALGQPIVVVLVNGQPMAEPELSRDCDALIETWYPGEAGGTALAHLLDGTSAPSGRLSIAIPRHVGQIPIGYRQKPSAQLKDYNFVENGPLYPFGYGLAYTEFSFERLESDVTDEAVEVSFEVRNAGSRAGTAVPQLYFRDDYASVTRPVRQLLRFSREPLEPGECRQVRHKIPFRELAFATPEGVRILEPGSFTFWVGADARAKLSTAIALTTSQQFS